MIMCSGELLRDVGSLVQELRILALQGNPERES